MNKTNIFSHPLFSMGFRVFFLLAGLFALIFMALWRSIYEGSVQLDNYFPDVYWHAHEMLIGYTVAVIAGFLLTAQGNWTGIKPVNAIQLLFLASLWIYGRVVPFYSGLLPDELIAFIDFSFLPCLLFFLIRPIIQSGQFQYLVFCLLLGIMMLGNGLIHLDILGIVENVAWQGLASIVSMIVLMIIVIAGKIFPFFTERGLSGVIAIRNPLIDALSIGSALITLSLWLFQFNGLLLACFSILTVVVNAFRIMGWFDRKVLYVPLLWVLYLGYGWILIGFIILTFSAFSLINDSIAVHAFAVGGIGVLTLGMMSRVSLGHTGRSLRAAKVIEIAFVLINLAAVVRVILPALMAGWYDEYIVLAIYLWLAAFSLFAMYYFPVLTAPRVDGKPE